MADDTDQGARTVRPGRRRSWSWIGLLPFFLFALLFIGLPISYLVLGSLQGLDGQLTTYKSYLGAPHPCLRCLFDDAMSDDALPSCAQGGVLGPVAGVMGTLQAVEVVKELTGIGVSLSGTLLLYDAATAHVERIAIPRRSGCACGRSAARAD